MLSNLRWSKPLFTAQCDIVHTLVTGNVRLGNYPYRKLKIIPPDYPGCNN